jgi:hypothetical protein
VVSAAPEPRLTLRELEHRRAVEPEVLREAMGIGHRADDDDGGARMRLQQLGHHQARAGGRGRRCAGRLLLGEGLATRWNACHSLNIGAPYGITGF